MDKRRKIVASKIDSFYKRKITSKEDEIGNGNGKSGSGGFRYAGQIAFIVDGFDNWKKVRSGKDCSYRKHEGINCDSAHQAAEASWKNIINPSQNIQYAIENFSTEQIANNRLRLTTTIQLVRRLAFQACSFRGRNKSSLSLNRGNFLEFYDILVSFNEKVSEAVSKAPKNATYTSHHIQKEILRIYSIKVKKFIREEIGDAKFCVIVDEARDESKRDQMALVIRFVDINGFVKERFFGITHVLDTTASTLKEGIYSLPSYHNLDVRNIRGQGYDGASNMRGEFNGLQAKILNDCPYAYYVHCFAHRLQLALVASSKEVIPIQEFFTKLTLIVNIVGSSCKKNDELKAAHASDVAYLISINELETGSGLNQIGTLQRARDTRWSSHYRAVCSLINMYSATCSVLLNAFEARKISQRGEARSAHEGLTTFKFVFVLHLMKTMFGITESLCQALQCKSHDILNAMQFVSSTRDLLQELRDDGFDHLISEVRLFCETRNVDIPDMDAPYVSKYARSHKKLTVEQYYRVDIFYPAIDSQLQELNDRFSTNAMELLTFSSALNPRDPSSTFRIDDICKLVNKFYPEDFTEFDKMHLKVQLQH